MGLGSNIITPTVGVNVSGKNFSTVQPYLPQSICLFGEANTANQSGLSTTPLQVTSLTQVGNAYGTGSPLYSMARILFNNNVSVPVYCFPQVAAGGSLAKEVSITISGSPLYSGTIYVKIGGRTGVDNQLYSVVINSTDDASIVATKIRTAINKVIGCQFIASGSANVVTLSSKWQGASANYVNVGIDLNNTKIAMTFAITTTRAGSGTPSVATSLGYLGSNWRTIIVNGYGMVDAILNEYEAVNGFPDEVSPTGRWLPDSFAPFVVFSGTTSDVALPSSITGFSGRTAQVTNNIIPAGGSLGMPYEIAASAALIWATIAQNKPHTSPLNQPLLDVPKPADGTVPYLNTASTRQAYVLAGCSTTIYNSDSGLYTIQDFVTTYAPAGDNAPVFKYVRDNNIYWNYAYSLTNMLKASVFGKTLIDDGQSVSVDNCISPSDIKALIQTLNKDFADKALISDLDFANTNITVVKNGTNPNRVDISVSIKISGVAYVVSADLFVGFNLN